jgi:hypothetical protein
MEQFLRDVKSCNTEGCTDDERLAIAKKYLSDLNEIPNENSALLSKVKELLRNFIDGKSHSLDAYFREQDGDGRVVGAKWVCSVCGKRNRETKKKYSECDTCGRPKDCILSKKLKQVNEYRVDPTPHLTNATEEELQRIKSTFRNSEQWIGENRNKRVFLSKKMDYEALERTSIKSEIDDVLLSIRQSLNDCT